MGLDQTLQMLTTRECEDGRREEDPEGDGTPPSDRDYCSDARTAESTRAGRHHEEPRARVVSAGAPMRTTALTVSAAIDSLGVPCRAEPSSDAP